MEAIVIGGLLCIIGAIMHIIGENRKRKNAAKYYDRYSDY